MADEEVLMRGHLQHRGGDAWRIKVHLGRSADGRKRYLERTVRDTRHDAERILAAAGHRLTAAPVLSWGDVEIGGGRSAAVPDRLPDLPTREAVRRLEMPLHLDWSRLGRSVDLSDRRQRARAYEVVLREGRPADIASIVDGALLVDLWDDLVLPRHLRIAWQPLIDAVVDRDA